MLCALWCSTYNTPVFSVLYAWCALCVIYSCLTFGKQQGYKWCIMPNMHLSRFNHRECKWSAMCRSITSDSIRSTFLLTERSWYWTYLISIVSFCNCLYKTISLISFYCANIWKRIILKHCFSLSFFSLIIVKKDINIYISSVIKSANEQVRMREYSNFSSTRTLIRISRIESDSICVRIIDYVGDSIVPFAPNFSISRSNYRSSSSKVTELEHLSIARILLYFPVKLLPIYTEDY